MKILHLCISNFYFENYNYQENILPKYHKKLGHEVKIVASTFEWNKEMNQPEKGVPSEYTNTDGIPVKRINYRFTKLPLKINDKLRTYKNLFLEIESFKPDLIFLHGLQTIDISVLRKYKLKYPNCIIYGDNHAAEINSAKNFISKYLLHKGIYRYIIKRNQSIFNKLFMIAPGCQNFANEMYDIKPQNTELLFLGADTEYIDKVDKRLIREKVRSHLGIKSDDFIAVTGGKINKDKNIVNLIKSLDNINNNSFKLIIFGSISTDLKDEIQRLKHENDKIQIIEWLNSEEIYDLFMASDLAVFPGSKSILWEQAICTGLPLLCRYWPGMDYVDVGGNVEFLYDGNIESISEGLSKLINNREQLQKMKIISESLGYQKFSFYEIAKQSLK